MRAVLRPLGELSDVFATVFVHAPIAMQIYNAEGQSLLVNQAFLDLFHTQPPPEYRILDDEIATETGAIEVLRRAFAGEPGSIRPVWYDPRDLKQVHVTEGRRVAFESHVIPLHDERGKVAFVLLFMSDRTEETRQREAIIIERMRIARLQSFTAALSRATTVAEIASVIVTRANAAFYAPRSLVALVAQADRVLDVIASHGVPPALVGLLHRSPLTENSPVTAAVQTGKAQSFRNIRAITEHHPEHGNIQLASDRGGVVLPLVVGARVLGIVILSFGESLAFTDERKADFDAFAHLAAQALDRALLFDLAQFERQRAEAASRAKDEFLAMVSHELRTPLNSMLGWATLLRGGTLAAETATKALETLERNARAQAQLIDDLLDIARITSGKLALRREIVDFGPVVRAASDAIRPAADARGVVLDVSVPDVACKVWGDAERLQQVAWNLLSNAVKFTQRGGHVRLEIRTRDDRTDLLVEDTGMGMDPAFVPFVFERFRQAEGGPSRSHGGLGLGLAIVRNLVELHGGSVEAFSEGRGRGSRFVVSLPLSVTSDEAAEVHIEPGVLDVTDGSVRGLHVLVVDDDDDARTFLATALGSWGCLVEVADSASQALALLEQSPPDVLVSDIAIPGEDGYALIEKVRALPPHRGGLVAAVALTAHARGEDRKRAIVAGFQRHVAKPVDAAELVTIIRSVASART
ncbi:two-component sensor histidine kinase [Labilithrix luteola]|uniref:histidine kinase n=1 Tax=Labilithrix luteola TaxID=1391654 RepID=A0A0K1PWN5_9BACT|nr:ATP-binding protein [Labilithrix luteola]AKU97549.1 two-component sensor histidine kinase [Labilithrix luteola]